MTAGWRHGFLTQDVASAMHATQRCGRHAYNMPRDELGQDLLFFSLNSSTRASSGVMVAHLTPTWYFLMASAESMVT